MGVQVIMKKTKHQYDLRVRPGVFKDGTFGIYAIPQDNDALEYQLIGQLESEEKATDLAQKFAANYQDTFSTNEIENIPDRELKLESIIADHAKDKQETVLREHLKNQFKAPAALKFRPLDRITNTTPHLLSYIALIIFWFSITIIVPSWVPFLGDWMGGKELSPETFASYYPAVIIFCALYVQYRVRKLGFQLALIRDYVLTLAIKHGWRREQFYESFMDVLSTSAYSWTLKLGEWMATWDPNSFSKGVQETRKNHSDSDDAETDENIIELAKYLLQEDFEARIHALYYMDKEKNYHSWTVVLYPILFLINLGRARRRIGHFNRSGFGGIIFDAVWGLPGEGEYRVGRRIFPGIAVYETLVIAGPLIWAFIISPWQGVMGWIGMAVLILLSVLPMHLWNFNLLVRHRGLPRSMALEEIQGDQRMIRAL